MGAGMGESKALKIRPTETVRLEKLIPGGQALGTLSDGRKCFVWGGLPGELVRVKVAKNKKTYAEGLVVGVEEASEHRVEPRDDCYLSTSPYQIMDYAYELEQKAELIREAFRQEHLEIDMPVIETDGQEYKYRNKMEYGLWWDNDTNRISLAFHMRGSHRKMPVDGSSIEKSEVWEEARRVVDELNGQGAEARRYQSLVVRCSKVGKVSSALLENGKPHPKMDLLNDSLLGREFSYSPNGFFQINLPVYELALREIKNYIKTDKVVDMYSGVGTIGLTVAADQKLTLVETDKEAFGEMRKNIAAGEHNIRPVCSKSEDALEYIEDDATIIVDPPRAGLHVDLVDKLKQVKPPMVIYLSCNPTTQARDVGLLVDEYELKLVKGYNFFPRTPHIESLVIMLRK